MCSDYVLLREHFKKAHVLCEEGECRDAEFTNAFRTDIDYRAHWAQKHSAGVGRLQARQMRQIDINVDFGDAGGGANSRGRGHRGGHQRGVLAFAFVEIVGQFKLHVSVTEYAFISDIERTQSEKRLRKFTSANITMTTLNIIRKDLRQELCSHF